MDKNDPRFNAALDINDPDFTEKFMDATGIKPGDSVRIRTPVFDRADGITPQPAPRDFDALPGYPEAALVAMGCGRFDEPDEEGMVLWLFPKDWYDDIPDGHMVFDIMGREEPFEPGVTDDDTRYGFLAYGFKRKADSYAT